MEAEEAFIPTAELSGPWIPGLHHVHKAHSFWTKSAWCPVSALFCVHCHFLLNDLFPNQCTCSFRSNSGATLPIKPVLNTHCRKKSFLVLYAKVAFFLYVFHGVILQTCQCFSLTPSPSITSGLCFQIYQSWQSKHTILEPLLFSVYCYRSTQ